MADLKFVSFDAGNTLIYAYPSVGGVYSMVTKKFGVDVSEQIFNKAFVPVFKGFLMDSETMHSTNEFDKQMWRNITSGIFNQIAELRCKVDFDCWFELLYETFATKDVWRFFDDAVPCLNQLRAEGMKLAIISNWDKRLRRICTEIGLMNLIDQLIISAEVGYRKPAPQIFKIALEREGVLPDEAIHVGDLFEHDVIGALNAGIYPVLIDRDQSTIAGRYANYSVIHDLGGLNALIKSNKQNQKIKDSENSHS